MATTWYLDIRELQPPFDMMVLDSKQRAIWTFNIQIAKEPSATLARELLAILVAASVGTENVDIFWSSKNVIPDGAGPYLSIMATGGVAGLRTQNVISGPAYERPTAQITARASTPAAAEAMSRAAYAALLNVRNTDVSFTP